MVVNRLTVDLLSVQYGALKYLQVLPFQLLRSPSQMQLVDRGNYHLKLLFSAIKNKWIICRGIHFNF